MVTLVWSQVLFEALLLTTLKLVLVPRPSSFFFPSRPLLLQVSGIQLRLLPRISHGSSYSLGPVDPSLGLGLVFHPLYVFSSQLVHLRSPTIALRSSEAQKLHM
jgi:hypothetical protein